MQRAHSKQLPLGVETQIPLERIHHDDTMTRPIDEEKVKQLMDSFRSKGQQQAIKVHPIGEYSFKVTFGEHRTEAARRLDWKDIRGVIQATDQHETLELKVTENAHRNGFVDPWEEGGIFVKLLSEKYYNNLNALSESIGKPTPYINDRVQVFHNLEPSLRQYVGNKLTVANTISLAKISPREKQLDLAQVIISTRTSGSSGFGMGASRGAGGKFVSGNTRVTTYHQCTCGCGNVHRDIRYELRVDPSEQTIGVKTLIGTVGRQPDFHVEREESPGFSYCGYKLSAMYVVDLPPHIDTRLFRIDGSGLCEVCIRKWRERN